MGKKYIINDNNKKLAWFIGFSDAEGCFQVYPKKRILKSGELSKVNVGYSYHLSLHKKDLVILTDIKSMLKDAGVVYEYKNKLDSRLAINDIPNLMYLIENVFDVWPLLFFFFFFKNKTYKV